MKKILAILLCLAMSLSAIALVACGGDPEISGGEGTKLENEIMLWGSSGDQTFLTKYANEWVKQYNADNGTKYTIKVAIQEEGKAGSAVVNSPEDAADVYSFADDQLDSLVAAGALAKISDTLAESLKTANNAGSVLSATYAKDGKMYAFPSSSDNANVLYYNTDYITPDADGNISLEDIMDKAAKEKKKVGYDLGDAWYGGGLFATFGGTVNKTETTYDNAEIAKEVATVATNLMHNPSWKEVLQPTAPDKSGEGLRLDAKGNVSVIAQVAYPSLYKDLKLDKQDNIAIGKMPTVKNIAGETVQIKSFYGSKLMGVNAASLAGKTEKQIACLYLANYLTSEEIQIAKAGERGTGPSNIIASQCDAAKASPVIQAVAAQGVAGVPQINLPGGYWDAVAAFVSGTYKADAEVPAYTVTDGVVAVVDAQVNALAAAMKTGLKLEQPAE